MQATSTQQLDDALKTLKAHAGTWASLSLKQRIDHLDRLMKRLHQQADRWVQAGTQAKGGATDPAVAAQEWLGGPYAALRNLRLLRQSLIDIENTGKPRLPAAVKRGPGNRAIVPVFPTNTYDKLLFMGITGEIWMQAEVTPEKLSSHMATAYATKKSEAEVCLVLGAGNVSSIGPMDCFYKLFNEVKVVILKMHPVNAYLGPIFSEIFAELIEAGFVQIVYGDAKEGAYLCEHEMVDEIHITGSDKTHDIIVFGRDTAAQKAKKQPLLQKPITSELGNVSPVIIVPGEWSASDLDYQAENLVSSLINNAGFNCNASRVLVTQKGWSQRDALLSKVREKLQKLAPRKAYYPGAADRYQAFKDAHPEAEEIGNAPEGTLPWMFIPNLDPNQEQDICFNTEAFCSLFCEVPLAADNPRDFMKAATAFANDTLWGTLNATVIIHPSSQRSPEDTSAFEQMIAELRYGTVAINQWAALGYALASTTWGAFPEHDLYDIQSGLDVVHNSYMLDKTEKSVVRCSFRQQPKPPYFASHRTAHQLGRKLTALEAEPSLFKLPGIFMSALMA